MSDNDFESSGVPQMCLNDEEFLNFAHISKFDCSIRWRGFAWTRKKNVNFLNVFLSKEKKHYYWADFAVAVAPAPLLLAIRLWEELLIKLV